MLVCNHLPSFSQACLMLYWLRQRSQYHRHAFNKKKVLSLSQREPKEW